MKTLLIKISAISILACSASAAPVLQAIPLDFDFGLSVNNSVLVHKFWLKSTGTDTVKIKNVEMACSCTTMPISQKVIAPGDSLEVEIRWDTQRSHGQVKRFSHIYYEGVGKPLSLGLFTDVETAPDSNLSVTVWPFRFELGKLAAKSVDSIDFRIKNTTDKDISAAIVSHSLEECEINVPDILPAKGEAHGFVKIKPEYADKEFENSITLKFSHDEKYRITVPIRRKIYGQNPG